MAFRLILEHTLKKYNLESLMTKLPETDVPVLDDDDECTVVSSSSNGMIPDGFTGLFLHSAHTVLIEFRLETA